MPRSKVTHPCRWRIAGCFNGSLCSKMYDHNVVPIFAFLMAKDDEMSGHRRFGVWCLKVIGQRAGLAEGRFDEFNVVYVSARNRLRGRVLSNEIDKNRTETIRNVRLLFKVFLRILPGMNLRGPMASANHNSDDRLRPDYCKLPKEELRREVEKNLTGKESWQQE